MLVDKIREDAEVALPDPDVCGWDYYNTCVSHRSQAQAHLELLEAKDRQIQMLWDFIGELDIDATSLKLRIKDA